MVTKCANASLNYMIYVQTVVKSCHAIFVEGSTGQTVVDSRALALVRGLNLIYFSSYHSVRKIKE